MHGFALNLDVDLNAFQLIVPCGIRGHGVTSVHALGGKRPNVRDVAFESPGLLGRALDLRIEHRRGPLASKRPRDVGSVQVTRTG